MKNWKDEWLQGEAEEKEMMARIAKFNERGEEYAHNGPGITARAHRILNLTGDIHIAARKLSAVGLDKIADDLTFLATAIHVTAEPIPRIVGDELTQSMHHSEGMAFGLLGVALKMAEKDGEIATLKAQQKQ